MAAKPREQRRTVLVSARMRVGARWGDVRILNISSRGLLIQSPEPPPRGSYLEVRRGRHTIVARVVWASDQRFGVQTQDLLSVDAIVREPDHSAPECRQPPAAEDAVERRARDPKRVSSAQRHEGSRVLARLTEFACIAFAGAGAALMGYEIIGEMFARPMTEAVAALAGPGN